MDDNSTRGGWWRTLPGLLTAVAALVTAVVGGVVALRQAGLLFTGAPAREPARVAGTERSSVAPPSSSVSLPSVSPAFDQVRVGERTYKIVSARFEPYDGERLALRLSVRLTNASRYPANFWNASFRLPIDSAPRAPEGDLNEVVSGGAASEGEVEFIVLRSARTLVLKVGDGDVTSRIPLVFTP